MATNTNAKPAITFCVTDVIEILKDVEAVPDIRVAI